MATPKKKPTPKKQKVVPAAKEKPSVHVLLRIRAESGETISAHANVIARKGSVLLGKFGRTGVGDDFKDALNRQIEDGVKTYLFLTTREGWRNPSYVTFRCSLVQVHSSLSADKRELVPAYYIHESPNIKAWFEISNMERLSQAEMDKIFVISTGSPIASAIRGLHSVFRVEVKTAVAK